MYIIVLQFNRLLQGSLSTLLANSVASHWVSIRVSSLACRTLMCGRRYHGRWPEDIRDLTGCFLCLSSIDNCGSVFLRDCGFLLRTLGDDLIGKRPILLASCAWGRCWGFLDIWLWDCNWRWSKPTWHLVWVDLCWRMLITFTCHQSWVNEVIEWSIFFEELLVVRVVYRWENPLVEILPLIFIKCFL